MPVIYAPETEYAKERCKWEAQGTECGPGLKPYVYRDLPTMMYLAGRPANELGAHIITDQERAETEQEEKRLFDKGYRRNPADAIKYLDDLRTECATLAAELNFEQKNRLSEKAAAEVDAARAQHAGGPSRHMPVVPETPIKKRGRKVKITKETN